MGGVISLISQLRLILSIAKTLMIVHEKGVFHGNLKCSNIFIHNNEIILSDFSIKPTEKIDW
jgi:tRNA A-37 threonylcarbamoyl transferase component Bud32